MRPPDPHQQSSNRPNLMSGTRKRTGTSGILDQLEPKAGRGQGSFSKGIEPRWVWAGGALVALLVAGLAAIAWFNANKPRALPAAAAPGGAAALAARKPAFESGPARIERVASVSTHKAAAMVLAQLEPPPMPPPVPLVVLPREAPEPAAAREPAPKKAAPAPRARAAPRTPSTRKPAVKRERPKPVQAPEAASEPDSDVALISAIRQASEKQSE
ncbi:MAG TPA: hypothetical protein VFT37_11105 [Telluria sp.]|nr:hypothetical protein [Telluria sp.]